MAETIWVNNHDLEVDLGLTELRLTEVDGWAAGLSYDRTTQSVVGSFGGFVSPDAMIPARSLRITAQLHNTVSGRDAELSKLLDVFTGLCEIRFGDATDKVLEGIISKESAAGLFQNMFSKGAIRVDIEVLCTNPTKRSRHVQSTAFGTSRTAVTLGNLPSAGIIKIMGDATGGANNPTITYRNSGGDSVETMGFTVSLGATEYLSVDLDAQTVKKYTAGVVSDAISTWTSGDWFVTDPADGSYEFSAWPMLETSGGTGLYTYFKRYRN